MNLMGGPTSHCGVVIDANMAMVDSRVSVAHASRRTVTIIKHICKHPPNQSNKHRRSQRSLSCRVALRVSTKRLALKIRISKRIECETVAVSYCFSHGKLRLEVACPPLSGLFVFY